LQARRVPIVERKFNKENKEKFYTELGFKTEGTSYLEDDIPHIKMRYLR
jgi:predicted GNAT family N-acyltransferase